MNENRIDATHSSPTHGSQDLVVRPPSRSIASERRTSGGSGAKNQSGGTAALVLFALRQWWKMALPLGLLFAGIGAAVVLFVLKPTYRAIAWLEIREVAPYVAFPDRDGNASRSFVHTQIQLMRTPLVLGKVVSNPEIARLKEIEQAPDRIAWLQQNVKVAPVGNSELYTVTCDCSDAAGAMRIVNAVVDSYFNLRHNDESEQTAKVLEVLGGQVEQRTGILKRLRDNVRELAKQATGKDPYAVATPGESALLHPVLADLHGRLTMVEVEEEVLKAELAAYENFQAKKKVEVPALAVEKAVEENAQIRGLEAALLAKKHRLLAREANLKDPKQDLGRTRLENEIKSEEGNIETLRKDVRQKAKARLENEWASARDDRLAMMKSQLESYGVKKKLLRERYADQIKDNKQYSGETFELQLQRDELMRQQKVLDLIEERAVKLNAETYAPARVTIRDRAVPPEAPIDSLYKKLVLAVLGGFCFPFALAVAWERLLRRVNDPDELEQQTSLPVVGEITRLPVRARASRQSLSARVGERLALFEESIDGLRTALYLSDGLRGLKTMVVTSAVNNEGKTSVAVELAVSIARATEHTTLLVDADMRSPDIHRLLGVELSPGLVDVLASECDASDAIVTTWSKYVHILPAGKLTTSPHRLLGNGNVKALLTELRSMYDCIVIDTPPLLACSESLVLAKAVDVTLLCAMRDVSRLDQVRKSHDRLLAAGVRPAGIVLNGISPKTYTSRYGSYEYFHKK